LPARQLITVKKTDWQNEFNRSKNSWSGKLGKNTKQQNANDGKDELAAFVARRTKNRSIESDLPLFTCLQTLLESQTRIILALSDPKLIELKKIAESTKHSFFYLYNSEFDPTKHLAINVLKARQFIFSAPQSLAFPHRNAGLLLLLAAILIYFAQTGSVKVQQTEIVAYMPEARRRLPDLVAAVLAIFFMVLGIGITVQIGFMTFSPAWFALNSIFWISCLPVALIWLVTGYYKLFCIDYSGETIQIYSYFSITSFPFNQLSHIENIEYEIPLYKRILFRLARLFARSAEDLKLTQLQDEPGFRLRFAGQQSFSFSLKYLTGLKELLDKAKDREIKVDDFPCLDEQI
jgi:hypothetical protein